MWRLTSRRPTSSRRRSFPIRRRASGLRRAAGEYYLHRFYKHQPDLNVANPRVRDEIIKVIGFWLELGLSGFRVDAVPFLLETLGAADADDSCRIRTNISVSARVPRPTLGDAILLGEVNLPTRSKLGTSAASDGDELTLQFDFIGMQNLYLSLARQDAAPLVKALADGRHRIAGASGRRSSATTTS